MLEKYVEQLSEPESELLQALDHETHMQTVHPRMLSGHVQGKFLEMLVRMLRPRRILEIGTFTGYCKIRFHIGSALDVAPALGGPFDLVFIDGDKREYPDYYRMLMGDNGGRPLVGSGSFLLADNILWSGKVVQDVAHGDRQTQRILEFNRMVVEDPRVENVIVPLRDGLNLIRVK